MLAAAVAATCDVMVNGPEGEDLDWDAIDWRKVEADVQRLRQRIFTASQAGDLKQVRNLQKLMLRSRSNTLLSVRRVTEVNAGRKTAGIDGQVVLLGQDKAELADWMQHNSAPWKAKPVKRVFIAKANGKQRPLGIPVIVDRALQARVSADFRTANSPPTLRGPQSPRSSVRRARRRVTAGSGGGSSSLGQSRSSLPDDRRPISAGGFRCIWPSGAVCRSPTAGPRCWPA